VFAGHDAVIHAAGYSSLSTQPACLQAAVQAGVSRFVLNEFANSPITQAGLPELEPYRKPRRKSMALAAELAHENPTFSWSAISTGNFIDDSLKRVPWVGFDIKQRKARLIDDGTEPFSAVTVRDVATAVCGILKHPEQTKNRMLHIRSVETCQVDILGAFKLEMGGQDWEVHVESSAEVYERAKHAQSVGDRKGQMGFLPVQLFAKGGGRSIVVSREDSDNELLGLVEKDIRVIVRDVLGTITW
jgi:hypothetical protein